MAIQTHCPTCHAPYNLAESQRGKKVRCRKCSNTFVVGGDDDEAPPPARSGRVAKDALQTSPHPPSRTPPPPSGRAKPPPPRRDRFRNDDEDGGDDGPPRRGDGKKSGSSLPIILMVGGGILLVFLLCGGAAIIGAYWWASATVSNGLNNIAQNMPQGGDPNDPNNGGFPFPGVQLPDQNNPKDVGEAVAWLKTGETADKKNHAADWLAKATVEDGRQKEVAAELEKLAGNPNTHDAAIRGLANWAGPDDAATLCKEVDTNGNLWQFDSAGGPAADALIRMQYKPAAAVFAKRLPDFFQHGNAEKQLAKMGALAEDDVLLYMDNPNNEAHPAADRLLREYGTKPEKRFAQALADLKNPDSGYERNACDYLAKAPVDEARRAETAKALETPLGDKDGETRKAAVRALKVWATKDSVGSIIAEMDNPGDPFHGSFGDCAQALAALKDEKGAEAVARHLPDGGQREAAFQALQQMGPVAERAIARYATSPDADVSRRANLLLKRFGTKPDVILAAAIDDLDPVQNKDANQRKAACEFLAKQPLDPAHQKAAARALEGLLDDTDPFAGIPTQAAKALAVWGDKDSVPALVKTMEKQGLNGDCWNAVVEALVKLKDERAVVPLILQAKNNPFKKQESLKALIQFGPLVEAALDGVVADTNSLPADRVAAIQLLYDPKEGIGTAKSIPVLQAAMADPNADVKKFASLGYSSLKKRFP